jgi:hypothetical protein
MFLYELIIALAVVNILLALVAAVKFRQPLMPPIGATVLILMLCSSYYASISSGTPLPISIYQVEIIVRELWVRFDFQSLLCVALLGALAYAQVLQVIATSTSAPKASS